MLKIKAPTHKVDLGGVLVSYSDPAWDKERIDRECAVMELAALAEMRAAAVEKYKAANPEATEAEIAEISDSCVMTLEERAEVVKNHPIHRYHTGATRFQLDAPDTDHEGKPVTVRDYLTAKPTEFSIRKLSYQEYHRCLETRGNARLLELMRCGLRAIRSDGYAWTPPKGDDYVPEEVVQALHEVEPALFVEIGAAVYALNQPLTESEKKGAPPIRVQV